MEEVKNLTADESVAVLQAMDMREIFSASDLYEACNDMANMCAYMYHDEDERPTEYEKYLIHEAYVSLKRASEFLGDYWNHSACPLRAYYHPYD